jgi:hypothetical protein
MLHTVTSSYRELARIAGLTGRPPPAVRKKQTLREMAARGEPRPSQKTKIGMALSQYTSPSNTAYDKAFHEEMKGIRPDWFLSQAQNSKRKKDELLRMARAGEPRPSHDKTRLGQALSNYTRTSSAVYDPDFDREIRRIRPDWFVYKNQFSTPPSEKENRLSTAQAA